MQFRTLAMLTARRGLRSKMLVALVAMSLPLLLFAVVYALSFLARDISGYPASQLQRYFDDAFVGAYLHLAIILGGMSFASSAFREEVDEQTLHHLFLQPIPRWMIPSAKLCGFLLIAMPIYTTVLLLAQLLVLLPCGPGGALEYLTLQRISGILLYIDVTLLGLLMYSSIFLLFSMFFRNQLFGFFLMGWEAAYHFLPEFLKNFTVSHYLRAMLPYQVPQDQTVIAVLSEGPGALQIFLVLFLTFGIAMGVSSYMATRKECLYGGA